MDTGVTNKRFEKMTQAILGKHLKNHGAKRGAKTSHRQEVISIIIGSGGSNLLTQKEIYSIRENVLEKYNIINSMVFKCRLNVENDR